MILLANTETVESVSALQAYLDAKLPDLIAFGIRVLLAFVVFFIGHQVIKWIRKIVRVSMERTKSDKGVRQFTDSLLKFSLHFLLILGIANKFGVESISSAALIASGGMAISLAMQGSLSNLAGGILILLLKPFVVGDYILEDGHGNEGTVEEIQIFYTKLSTVDNKTIIVPNGPLANTSLTNVTASSKRQLDLRVGVSYEADIKEVKEVLYGILRKNKNILQEEDMKVFVDDLGESAVVMGVRAWVDSDNYLNSKWDLLEDIKTTLDEKNIEIPYRNITVHMNN